MEKFFPALLSYKPWPLYSSLSPERVEESGEARHLVTLLVLLSDHTADTSRVNMPAMLRVQVKVTFAPHRVTGFH